MLTIFGGTSTCVTVDHGPVAVSFMNQTSGVCCVEFLRAYIATFELVSHVLSVATIANELEREQHLIGAALDWSFLTILVHVDFFVAAGPVWVTSTHLNSYLCILVS